MSKQTGGKKATKDVSDSNDDNEMSETSEVEQPKNSKKTAPGSKSQAGGKGKKMASKGTKARAGTKGTKKAGSKTAKRGVNKQKGGDRYFKTIDAKTGDSYGRYTGETPKQAASKAYTKLLQKFKSDGKAVPKQSTTIFLRESTRGSARKIYGYEASRQKLKEPQRLFITDKETGEEKEIVYHFRNKIKKVTVPEQIGGARSKSSKKGSNKGSKRGTTGTSGSKSKGSSKVASKSGTGSKSMGRKATGSATSGKKNTNSKSKPTTKKSQNAKATTSH